MSIDRTLCDNCGVCLDACARKALTIYGKVTTAEEVVEEVLRDAPFHRRSGGGVTISGGEPLQQPEFLVAILEACRGAGLHTAIETSCYAANRIVRRVMHLIDLVMFDLKAMDAEQHRSLTGNDNHLILNNARLFAESGCKVQPRMPLIPGLNDSPDNLSAVASFLHSMKLPSIELMPYHQFGKSKYRSLGRAYEMGDLPSPKSEEIERASDLLVRNGVSCLVSK